MKQNFISFSLKNLNQEPGMAEITLVIEESIKFQLNFN